MNKPQTKTPKQKSTNDEKTRIQTGTFYQKNSHHKKHTPKLCDFSLIYLNHKVQLGIITKKTFYKGQIVADLDGEVVNDIRQHTVQIGNNLHLFDPFFCGYISHSCDPNLRLIGSDLQLIALKNINPSELLTLNYNDTEDRLFKAFQCQCGTPICQGWIQGKNPEKKDNL